MDQDMNRALQTLTLKIQALRDVQDAMTQDLATARDRSAELSRAIGEVQGAVVGVVATEEALWKRMQDLESRMASIEEWRKSQAS